MMYVIVCDSCTRTIKGVYKTFIVPTKILSSDKKTAVGNSRIAYHICDHCLDKNWITINKREEDDVPK